MVFINSAGREVKKMAREPRRKTVVTRKAGRPLSKWTAFSGNAFSARMRKLNFPHGLS